jgi:hypothetical protein
MTTIAEDYPELNQLLDHVTNPFRTRHGHPPPKILDLILRSTNRDEQQHLFELALARHSYGGDWEPAVWTLCLTEDPVWVYFHKKYFT